MKLLYITHHRRFKTFARPALFARVMAQAGHEVTLLCTADQARFRVREGRSDGVRVIEMPDLLPGALRSGWDPVSILRRSRAISLESFDALHLFETRPATIYPALNYAQGRTTPLIIDWNDWWGRGGLIRELRPRWYQLLFEGFETYYEEHFRTRARVTTVISHALGERAVQLGVPPTSVHWIPGAADLQHFTPADRLAARRALGLPAGDFLLGYSALDVVHDASLVVAAVARVLAEWPTARLVMTGQPRPALAQLAAQHGIAERFTHLGLLPYDRLPTALAAMDLLLLPFTHRVSNLGRWPNKVGDYLASGRPVLTNPVGEMKTFFQNQPGRWLADEQPEAFAQAILHLARNRDEREAMGAQARRLAEQELTPDRLTQRLLAAYAAAV